ncbi:lysine--tRNA ligase [Candidatus Micrarchaeota archaeon]|nr:lysine--tRNA ligase [Candidatus Micrarchaeota archaeon]
MTTEKPQLSQFWADRITAEAKPYNGKHVIGDAKTPSGRIHVGSLRGVLIHDVIYKAVRDSGQKAEYVYRFDDLDPMDGFPPGVPESFREHMGKPLCDVPNPEPKSGQKSFARLYAEEFQDVFEKLDCKPRIAYSSELYRAGKLNKLIHLALERAVVFNEINARVAKVKKPVGWLPINVICPECGKIGTTRVSDFDGKTVAYQCADVKYAKGCCSNGRISPFDGHAKLTWKADWAAAFVLHGVTIEGAGKDHYAAGGSRDVANEVVEKVFDYPHPYNFPYEFFIMGGKKMSTSKGVGVSAVDMGQSLPPELLRFVMTRYKPQTAIDFNPDGETVPRLYDDWDRFSRITFGHETVRDPDVPRIFALSQVQHQKPTDHFHPPFSYVAFLSQIPGVHLADAMEKYKGTPLTMEEKHELDGRARYTKVWLERFAPEDAKIRIVETPDYASLSARQKEALNEFAQFLEAQTATDIPTQVDALKAICEKNGLKTGDFFAAAYKIFIGRDKGPKLLPFLAALDKKMVQKRLRQQH